MHFKQFTLLDTKYPSAQSSKRNGNDEMSTETTYEKKLDKFFSSPYFIIFVTKNNKRILSKNRQIG
jgi:hypothetical protein